MIERQEIAPGIVLYCGDCRAIIPTLGHSGPVITDPPYLEGDQSEILDLLSDNHRVAVTPGKSESFNWIRRRKPTWEYAWQTAARTLGGAACFHMGFEPLLSYGYPTKPPGTDLLNFPIQSAKDKPDHPWPKPIQLMSFLVEHWSAEGETVLDPFMGSGTTGVACLRLGRKFIGIEINPKYFAVACKRIAEATQQTDLFIAKPKPAKQLGLLAAR